MSAQDKKLMQLNEEFKEHTYSTPVTNLEALIRSFDKIRSSEIKVPLKT